MTSMVVCPYFSCDDLIHHAALKKIVYTHKKKIQMKRLRIGDNNFLFAVALSGLACENNSRFINNRHHFGHHH